MGWGLRFISTSGWGLDPRSGLLLSRGGGGFGPKTWCTKNGLTRFSLLQISFFPTMVTLVWGGGEGVLGEGPPPPWFLIILKKPCPRWVTFHLRPR